jgi:hypothetical protein
MPGEINEEAQRVGNDTYNHDELGELREAPGPLKITAAEKQGERVDNEAKYVLLDQGGSQQGPWVLEGLARNEGQQGRAVAYPSEERQRAGGDEEGVEDGQADEEDEEGSRQGRDVESSHRESR